MQVTGGAFVGRVSGLRIERDAEGLRDALDRFAVLIVPNYRVDAEGLCAVAAAFGRGQSNDAISNVANGAIISAQDEANIAGANRLWHMDSVFSATPPLVSLLNAHELPRDGGATQFADLRAAWRALPFWRRLSLLNATDTMSLKNNRARIGLPPLQGEATHPVAPKHPRTGRRNLFVSTHGTRDDLLAFASQDRFVYTHHWSPGDLVLWDNRCVLHRVLPYNHTQERRVLLRAEALA